MRKYVITKNHDEMFFGTLMDQNLDWIDMIHFPDVARRYPWHINGFYRITGRVVADFGAASIEVIKCIQVGYKHRSFENLN